VHERERRDELGVPKMKPPASWLALFIWYHAGDVVR